MKPIITLITIGVDDLEAAIHFYRDGLGLHTKGVVGEEFEHGAVAFFELESGLTLALWPRESIAHDTGIAAGPKSPTEVTLAHNVGSKQEVDAVMEQARQAGAKIVKPADDTFWGGYAGYFQDPDEHLWEVAWNPKMSRSAERKEAAIDFLRLAASGNVHEAYRKHVGPEFRHHNPYFRGDADSLMEAMAENAQENPDKILEVQRALQDGDLIAVHSRVRQKPGDRGGSVVHIFRFDGDRVAELWDIGMAVPEESLNEHGMF